MSVYQFNATKINGEEISLDCYKGKVLLIVNTASKCGFTPQYGDLQSLYAKYKDDGFIVLGFPCNQFMAQEPGDNMEIDSYCRMNYGVDFPLFAKIDVKGESAHPLFRYLAQEAPGVLGSKGVKWNFTKFLIDKEGKPVKRFSPKTKPKELEEEIITQLNK